MNVVALGEEVAVVGRHLRLRYASRIQWKNSTAIYIRMIAIMMNGVNISDGLCHLFSLLATPG